MPPRTLQEILDVNPELEVSDGWNGDGPAPLQDPVPVVAHDLVPVRPEAGQPAIPPLAAEGEAKSRRPRKVAQAAPAESRNGSEPSLTETFLLTGQVAGLLQVHQGSVLRIVARGDLAAIKVGGRLLVPSVALEEFLTSRRVPTRRWAMRRNVRSLGRKA